MMRPLYKLYKDKEDNETQGEIDWKEGNAGLWYDKFCDKWQEDFSGLGDEGKKEWVESVTRSNVGDKDQIGEHSRRIVGLLEALGQDPLCYRLESDFVTGLGREHPIENGFAWHPTLGTPYLPGSSVKGLVRAWAEQWADPKPLKDIKRIFGSESKDDRDFRAGSVVFLDALPTKPVRLKADVMTPHYGPYYQDPEGNTPPADWYSPNPIPFLVVAAGASFLFGILPRREKDSSDCKKAREWLKEALEGIGAGAKTAVGYGRFAEVARAQQNSEKKLEEQRSRGDARFKQMKMRIERHDPTDIGSLPTLIQELEGLPPGESRKELAGLLFERALSDSKKRRKHREKGWFKRLDEMRNNG
jgi:CRISPR-associated protein Cmr6